MMGADLLPLVYRRQFLGDTRSDSNRRYWYTGELVIFVPESKKNSATTIGKPTRIDKIIMVLDVPSSSLAYPSRVRYGYARVMAMIAISTTRRPTIPTLSFI